MRGGGRRAGVGRRIRRASGDHLKGRRKTISRVLSKKPCLIETRRDGLLWRGGPMVARPSSLGSVQTSRALAQCQRCPRVPPTGSQNTSLNQKTSEKGIDPPLALARNKDC